MCFQFQSISQTGESTEEIDQVISLIYGTISGPAGERNWDLFKTVFHPEAHVGAVITDSNTPKQSRLATFNPSDYIKNNRAFLLQQNFYEREIGRKMLQFGDLAQVMSAFEYRFAENGPVKTRGINTIMLVRVNSAWKVISLLWQDESSENPLPAWADN